MYDVVLRGGLVIDGTGAPGLNADIGIAQGRIVDVRAGLPRSGRDIDVEGLVVSPGFIDIHTHYDAQIHWDPSLSPSGLYGVTTVIGGNCGFTVAPMMPAHASYLTRMLARVEGMPLEALEHGLSMDWRGFGEWLDRLEGCTSLNVGFLAGHSTIRRLVMGDTAVADTASKEQIEEMQTLLASALTEGALGLSSSWSPAHTDGEGLPVPSRFSSIEELLALCTVTGKFDGTVLEFVPGAGSFGEIEATAMTAMSLAADRPLNWNVIRVDTPADLSSAEARLAASDLAAKRGAVIVGLTNPDPLQLRVSVATGVGFRGLHGWELFATSSRAEQCRLFADDAFRRRLRSDAATGDAKWPQAQLRNWSSLGVAETYHPLNAGYEGRTIGSIAAESSEDPFDVFSSIVSRDEMRTYFLLPPLGTDADTWRLRVQMLRDHRTLLGGSDAGAHLGQMCGARYTTSLLAAGVREHRLLATEEAVHYLTGAPAEFYGLVDRGRIAPGYWADLVAFDPDTVTSGTLRSQADLPGGASRLYSEPEGITYVLVNGSLVVANGTYTNNRPGHVLRSGGSHTRTVNLRRYRELNAPVGGGL